MIDREMNPDFLNSFLDYNITILNKSPNSIKEYNYDLMNFLKYIKIHFKLTNEKDWTKITINDISLDTIKKIKLEDTPVSVHRQGSCFPGSRCHPAREKVPCFAATPAVQKAAWPVRLSAEHKHQTQQQRR